MNHRGARQRTQLWLCVTFCALLNACGSLTSMEAAPAGCPPEGCFGDASVDGDAKGPSPDAITPQPDSAVPTSPFCGSGCDPDQDQACINVEMDAEAGDAADMDMGVPEPDGSTAADAMDESDASGGNMGGKFGASSSPSGGEDAGAPSPAFACQVTWNATAPISQCTLAGPGKMNDPCSRSSDCAAGLTCVGTLTIGRCLKYCCLGNDACPAMSEQNPLGLYCSDEISRDYLVDHAADDPSKLARVPVCVAGRGCDPVDPENDPKRCETGLSCAIVRSDGTTGCIALPDDAAKDGGSCKDVPCAEGYICAKANNVCMKLCHTSASDECAAGVCQAGTTSLPAGLGICGFGTYDN